MPLVSVVGNDESLSGSVQKVVGSGVSRVKSFASTRRRVLRGGAVSFLGKSFWGDHLLDTVRAALGRGDPRR